MAAAIATRISCHSFRATGITTYPYLVLPKLQLSRFLHAQFPDTSQELPGIECADSPFLPIKLFACKPVREHPNGFTIRSQPTNESRWPRFVPQLPNNDPPSEITAPARPTFATPARSIIISGDVPRRAPPTTWKLGISQADDDPFPLPAH
jgi:hypothetical protein